VGQGGEDGRRARGGYGGEEADIGRMRLRKVERGGGRRGGGRGQGGAGEGVGRNGRCEGARGKGNVSMGR